MKPDFRQQAEEILRQQSEKDLVDSPQDISALLHELRVHQIELQLQNSELRQSQQQMASTHRKYVELYDFAPVGYFTLTTTGIIREVNLTGAQMLGTERKYLLNQALINYLAPESFPAFTNHLRHVFTSSTPQTCDLILQVPGRDKRYIELKSALRLQGEARYCWSIVSDVTTQVENQQALAQQQHFLESVFELAPVFIYIHDLFQNRDVYNNRAWREFHRLLPEDFHHIDIFEFLLQRTHPDDLDQVQNFQRRIMRLRDTEVLELTYRIKRPDGRYSWLQQFFTVFKRTNHGGLQQILSVAIDISTRKQTEVQLQYIATALQNQTNLLNTILDTMVDGVIAVDEEGRFLVFNLAAEAILGQGVVDVSLNDWPEIFQLYTLSGDRLLQPEELPLQRALQDEQQSPSEFMIKLGPGNQNVRLVSAAAQPLYDEQNQVKGGVLVLRDITQAKQTEQILAEKVHELARSNLDLEQFAYIASHDLQEPLRLISSYVRLLERRYSGQLDDQADKYIQYAVDGSKRLQTLINDLLLYTILDNPAAQPVEIDSQAVLGRVLKLLAPSIEERKAQIKVTDLPIVVGIAGHLTQVFQNLLSNALKYHHPDSRPEIEIGAVQQADMWQFHVRDNGIGLSSEQAEKVFDIFKRLHSRRKYSGNGMGLAICRKIVEQHGGKIWVESAPNAGATFFFTLPACRSSTSTPDTEDAAT